MKQYPGKIHERVVCVAPCAGAWIETSVVTPYLVKWMSPPARGRGLKLLISLVLQRVFGRPLRGGVD